MAVKYAEPSDELLAKFSKVLSIVPFYSTSTRALTFENVCQATFWVAAEGLTQGAGVYIDASYSAVVSQTRTNTSPYGAPRSVSGVRAAGASGASGGGSKLWASGQWGERPAAFVKDLTAHIPEGTYGWWPLSIRVPAGASVGDRGAETVPRRPLMLTMFVLMRGARGTLWMDSLSVSPSRAPTAPYGIAQVMPSIKPLQSLPRSLLQAARAGASLSPGSEDGYAAERRPELAGSWLGLPGTGTSHVATGRFLESALANVRGGSAERKGGRGLLGQSWGEGGRGRRLDDAGLWLGLENAAKSGGMRELRVFHRRAAGETRPGVCVCVCVCVCVYMHIHIHVHMHVHIRIRMHVHMYMYTYTYTYTCAHTYTYTYAYTYAYVYTYTYAYTYTHTYTYN